MSAVEPGFAGSPSENRAQDRRAADMGPRDAAERSDPAPDRAAEQAPALPWDWSSAWIVVLTAVAMGFLSTLALALHAGVDKLAASWTGALDRQATILLTLPESETARATEGALVAEALAAARAAPGVSAATALPADTTRTLLEPLLGAAGEGLLNIRLIDIRLAAPSGSAEGQAILARTAAALSVAGVEAEVDGHGEWIERLRPAATAVKTLAGSALAVIAVACGLMIALACSTAMAAQARIIEVLRLVGAYDRYIARLFVRRFQILAFLGGGLGMALGVAALFLGPLGVQAPPEIGALAPLTPELTLDAGLWARFALTPLGLALIATVAARLAVAARLRRLEG